MNLPRVIVGSIGIIVVAAVSSASAQEVHPTTGAMPSSPRLDAPAAYLTGPFLPTYSSSAVPVQSVYWPPYSYWAAWPLPARDYVGYGSNDFSFHGRRYGSPSDPWSWSGLAGYPARYRYYYPPVR